MQHFLLLPWWFLWMLLSLKPLSLHVVLINVFALCSHLSCCVKCNLIKGPTDDIYSSLGLGESVFVGQSGSSRSLCFGWNNPFLYKNINKIQFVGQDDHYTLKPLLEDVLSIKTYIFEWSRDVFSSSLGQTGPTCFVCQPGSLCSLCFHQKFFQNGLFKFF